MASDKSRFNALKYIACLARKHKKVFFGCFAAALGGGIISQDVHVAMSSLYSGSSQIPEKPVAPEYIELPSGVTYDYIVDDYPEASKTSWFRRRKHGEKFMHWKLLQLSKNKSRHIRHLTLKALSELPGMTDAEYREIAQASDYNSCVGLARIEGTDQRFFLPPPPIPEDMAIDRIENELRRLLLYLPVQESDPCLQVFTFAALKAVLGDEQSLERGHKDQPELVGVEEMPLSHIPRQDGSVVLCLQALLRHSTHQECHTLLIHSGLLPLLQRVRMKWPDRTEFHSLIAQILGNLALNPQIHRYIFSSGWIGLLASWYSNGGSLDVTLSAARALANLDGDNSFKEHYSDGVYPLYPLHRKREDNLEADIVFVHGLLGGAFKTWRQHDSCKGGNNKNYSQCWPKDWLSTDFLRCRIIAIDYDSQLSNWRNKCPLDERNNTLACRSEKLLEKLLAAGLGERPIIWITHSMGGLLVKKMLLNAWDSEDEKVSRLVEQTRGIVFCSVPHRGSPLANLKPSLQFLFLPSTEVQELKDTPHVEQEHQKLITLLEDNNIKCLSFGETLRTVLGFRWTVLIVSPDSADPGIGEFHTLDVNHLDTCKPENRISLLYSSLVKFICNCLYSDEENQIRLTQHSKTRPLEMALMTEFC